MRCGPWRSDAFDPSLTAAKTLFARRALAQSIIGRFRCSDEVPSGSSGPDGDAVFKADFDQVLAEFAGRVPALELRRVAQDHQRLGIKGIKTEGPFLERVRSLTSEQRRGYLACIFGFDACAPEGLDHLSARLACCLAADYSFAPYAAGLDDALTVRPSDLQTAIRSMGQTIWMWARRHKALARTLSASYAVSSRGIAPSAEADPSPTFSPFVNLITACLRRYVSDADEPILVAGQLARLAAEQIAVIGPGRHAHKNLIAPSIELLLDLRPTWGWGVETSGEELLASGAAQLVLEVVVGTRTAGSALRPIEALSATLRNMGNDG